MASPARNQRAVEAQQSQRQSIGYADVLKQVLDMRLCSEIDLKHGVSRPLAIEIEAFAAAAARETGTSQSDE